MNPYGQFFGVPQQYYGGVAPAYPSFMPTSLVGYPQVAVPAQTVTTSQPATTQASTTETATIVTITSEKTPVTTVFVGNIPERAPDSLIKTLLMVCSV